MKEDIILGDVERFNVQKYVETLRLHGRASIDKDVRGEVVELYERVSTFRREESFISQELAETLDLVERTLFSEWFLLANTIPRFPAYTNVRVLNWILGTHRRKSLPEVWIQCWKTIRFLLQDLISFEVSSMAGVQSWQQCNFDLDVVKLRISSLRELHAQITNSESLHPVVVSLDVIPKNWSTYSLDNSRVSALIYLTAFPQTLEHDEYLFLRTIHLSECCFWGILTSVIASIESTKQGRIEKAINCLAEATSFAEILIPLFQAFKTMSPDRFTEFRDATGDASAIQSRTYQLMQIYTQGLDDRKASIIAQIPEVGDLLLYGHPGFVDLRTLVRAIGKTGNEWSQTLASQAERLDHALYTWRCLHLGIARKYLPPSVPGTGGTKGTPYLETHFKRRIFPVDPRFAIWSDNGSTIQLHARPILSHNN